MADTLSQALLEASLLASLPEEDEGSVIIDVDKRSMVLPTGFFFGVYNDKDILKVPFVIPRYYNELDLSEFQITVNYINSAGYGNVYRVTNAEVTDSTIRFKWVTGRGVFVKEGTVRFIVCLRQIGTGGEVEKEFNTTIASANVLKGLEVDENPDPVAYSILAHMEELEDQAEAAVEVAEGAAERIDDAVTEAEQAIAAMYHSPYIAPTAADMLSHDKVYVYTGNETGYTFGNWYYWNGSAFVSGGVYNATAFETDDTLSISGAAADAKKTGDEISGLKEDITHIYEGEEISVKGVNRLNPAEVEIQAALQTDGTTAYSSGKNTTGYISLDTNKTYVAITSDKSDHSVRLLREPYRCAFYDENKEFITTAVITDNMYPIRSNAAYFRLTALSSYWNYDPMVEFVDSASEISSEYAAFNDHTELTHGMNYLDETQQDIVGRLDRVEDEVVELEQLDEMVSDTIIELHGFRQEAYTSSGSNFKEKYYINSSGTEVSSSSWNIFSLALNGETGVIYSHLTSSYSGNPKWVFFDSQGDVVSVISPVNSADDTILLIPDTAVLLRASISNTDKTDAKIALYIEKEFLSKDEVMTEINTTMAPVKEKIGYFVTPLIHGAYIKTYSNSNIVPYADLDNPTANDNWYYQKIACSEGDYFVISGSGGDSARLWGFFDVDGKCLMMSDSTASATNLMIKAPINSAWLVVNSTVDASVTSANVFDAIKDKPKVEFVNDVGISWEWWINCHYTDQCGNLYIGFIDKEKFCGVLCRKADGTVVYKRKLFQSYTADDHSACSVNMLSDGRLVVMATQGHTGDYRHFALAQKPYTINCDFNTSIININPPEGHRYNFSYSQEFIDENDVIYNFFRISGYTIGTPDVNDGRGWGYIKSEDYGQTWKLYRFLSKDTEYQTDPYLSVKDVEGEDTLKRILVQSTSEQLGGNVIYAGFVDLASGAIYDNVMTPVGSSSEVPDVVTVNTTATVTNYVFDGTPIFTAASNLTPVVTIPTTAGQRRRIRLLNIAKTGDDLLAFVYGKAKDEVYTFEYRLYYDGNDIALTDVGLNYYKSYIPGADLSYDGKTVFCSVNVALVRDGRHAIHRIVTDGTQVVDDMIINVSNRLLAKPILSDNGILSLLSGKYNEPDDSSTNYNKWEFMPVFLNV